MLNSLLVYLDETPLARDAIDAAVELARRHEARLRTLTIVDTRVAQAAATDCEGAVFALAEHERLSRVAVRQMASSVLLAQSCISAGVDFDVRREAGDPQLLLSREARLHDLVFVAREGSTDQGFSGARPASAHDLVDLVQAGTSPLLVHRHAVTSAPRILLVDDGTPSSGRNVRTFLSQQIWPAGEMRLLAVAASRPEVCEILREAVDYCRSLRVEVETGCLCGTLRGALLPYARHWGADVVVLGIPRQNGLVRRVLGAAAVDLLNETSCNLYLGA